MSNDFSDFNIDDIYYGVDADDAPPDMPVGDANGEKSAAGGVEPPAAAKSENAQKPGGATKPAASGEDTPGGAQKSGAAKPIQEASGTNTALKTFLQLSAIALLLVVAATQLMGIVYRDTLDTQRTSSSADKVFAALEAADEILLVKKGAAPSARSPSVKQVEIGGGNDDAGTSAAKKAAAKNQVELSKSQPTMNSAAPGTAAQKPAPPPPPASSTATAAETARAVGTHAVAVGIFRSQRHVAQLKKQLEGLSLPYFTRVKHKDGTAYVVRTKGVATDTLEAAKAALAKSGYDYTESGSELSAYFHYDDEALKALALVSSVGAAGAVEKVTGSVPVWQLLAGPMSSSDATAAAKKLSRAKVENYVLRLAK